MTRTDLDQIKTPRTSKPPGAFYNHQGPGFGPEIEILEFDFFEQNKNLNEY